MSGPVPAGVREIRCKHCGIRAWIARLHPEARAARGRPGGVILLEPFRMEGAGNVVLTRDGLATFSGRFPGEFAAHMCPTRISSCKYCGRAVRMLHQPPGAAERLAVLDAEPDPRGPVVVNEDGYAVRDPHFTAGGERFRWHDKHGGGETEALMRETPGGRHD